MSRDEIIEAHYAKARREMALLWAIIPFMAALLLAFFIAGGTDGPVSRRGGGGIFALLAVVPLVVIRDWLSDNRSAGAALGIALPMLGGFLATGEIWVSLLCGALGAAGARTFYTVRGRTSYRPKLNRAGRAKLTADLAAHGHEEEFA
ncbi:hypothetical protein [Pseudoroseicyclus sp. CXY001]|uniref:hypothetical protein n=1 Tax=Pseudoroseicyclus sp. CXY001 TaxID=3242492 RepID=UPI00358DC830